MNAPSLPFPNMIVYRRSCGLYAIQMDEARVLPYYYVRRAAAEAAIAMFQVDAERRMVVQTLNPINLALSQLHIEGHPNALRPLTVEGCTPHDVARDLLTKARTMVRLEPGDATRYTLLLTALAAPHARALGYDPHAWLVVRDVGGRQDTTIANPHATGVDLAPLTGGSSWTMWVLTWYLDLLRRATTLLRVQDVSP